MPTPPPSEYPADRCPLCGGDNRCAVEIEKATGQPQGACWCVTERFPPHLLASLPAQAQGKACVCAQCLAAFQPSLFSERTNP